jgi:hypothetical protein
MVLNAVPRLMEEFEQSCASGFLIASSQTPKVFTLRGVPEDPGTHLFGTPRPPRSYGSTRLPQPRPSSMGSGQWCTSGAGTQWL